MESKIYNNKWENVTHIYPNGYFDWCISDIPYGIDITKMAFIRETKTSVKQKNGTRLNPHKNKKVFAAEHWDSVTPSQEYFNEMKRISKNQIIFGVEYVNWEGLGIGRIKWNKGFAQKVSFKKYELAYCSSIDFEYELNLLWAGMCQAKSLEQPMTQQGNKKLNEKRIHPCHKPILLYRKILQEFCSIGDKIIDTHLGGGSNRIAADMFGISEFIGVEASVNHFNDQEQRWSDYLNKKKQMLFL